METDQWSTQLSWNRNGGSTVYIPLLLEVENPFETPCLLKLILFRRVVSVRNVGREILFWWFVVFIDVLTRCSHIFDLLSHITCTIWLCRCFFFYLLLWVVVGCFSFMFIKEWLWGSLYDHSELPLDGMKHYDGIVVIKEEVTILLPSVEYLSIFTHKNHFSFVVIFEMFLTCQDDRIKFKK